MHGDPACFIDAIGMLPGRRNITVDGATIECPSWGERGRPAILLLHRTHANAGWCSHIASSPADRYHVSAQLFFWGEALGLDRTGPPIVAGHSYGSRLAAAGSEVKR